jgi:chromosomal replication initiator protein
MEERSAKEIWEAALGELQLQVTRANYDTWLRDTIGLSYEGDLFVVGAPTTFATEWLQRRLQALIKKTLKGITGGDTNVQFVVQQPHGAKVTLTVPGAQPSSPREGTNSTSLGNSSKLNPKYTFASFIEGRCNRLARAAAMSVAENPGISYNPLLIYAGTGLGKTHLLHAIGHLALERRSNFLYVSSEQFTNEFISAIQERKMGEFRNRFRRVDLLLVDDIQFIADKEQTQEEFFHTFNDLHSANHQIIISSDRHPKSMPLLEDRLRSRFEWGLIADIQPPDLETRLAILRYKAQQQGAEVSEEILELIARKIQSNIRDLEGSLNRVLAYSKLTRTPLALEQATQALADIAPERTLRAALTPALVMNTVAAYFGLDPDEIKGNRRTKKIALARQIVMYLLREEGQLRFGIIGRELGGRDHSTVLHGWQKIAHDINVDNQLRRDVLEIKNLLYSK